MRIDIEREPEENFLPNPNFLFLFCLKVSDKAKNILQKSVYLTK
jgi:hypothetical protein